MLEILNPLNKKRVKKIKPERLADTLLFFVNETILDKNNRALKLDYEAERLRFIVYHALNSGAADSAIAASTSADSLRILKGYFSTLANEKVFSTRLLKPNEKSELIHKLTTNPKYGQVALLSVGNLGSKISKELEEKSITIETLTLAEEIGKRIADSATSTAKDTLDTFSTFYGLFKNKDSKDVSLNRLTHNRKK